MRNAIIFVALFGLVAVNAATPAFDKASFCQRYAAALNNVTTPTADQETGLITAVLKRALFGGNGTTPAVNGILNDVIQMPFFNGSCQCTPSKKNFYTDLTAQTALFNALVNFFSAAMGCRETTTTSVANMNTVHASMNINKAVWNGFVGEVVATLKSFGVTDADVTYVAALVGQFNKGGAQAICTASDCATATDFAEFTSGTDSSSNFAWLQGDGSGSQSVTITQGGNVHINIGSIHYVKQTDSNWSPNGGSDIPTTAPGANTGITVNFPNTGTYYFICPVHPSTMRATITVKAASGDASSNTAAFGVVIAAVASALFLNSIDN